MSNDARSSNGRISDSELEDVGSTPTHAAIKYCNRCKKNKSIKEFTKRGLKLQPWCKYCKNKWDRDNYRNNSSKRREQIKNRKLYCFKKAQEFLINYFLNHPCVDCNEKNIIVLEFDHLDDKEFNILAAMRTGFNWQRILKEIDKCDVVCCNCHRIRTSKRNKSWRVNI